MCKENAIIRETAKKSGVHLWQVAEKLGLAESTFIRRLRHELPAEEQRKVLNAIAEISKEAC
ncbi:hypothetical protein SDC9_65055 [bioreactor metagenome]|uniref:HTH araC/xylS-type domain-containing protein n=1 Tax=bioreactor metagenome TaxID=1076179 RepID=A0A644XQX9_9ZZZZ